MRGVREKYSDSYSCMHYCCRDEAFHVVFKQANQPFLNNCNNYDVSHPFRYRIRGIKNIIFYQLPLYPVFYPEIINFMEADADAGLAANSLCSIIYSRYDRNRLENIIGTQQCKQIFMSTKNIHMIVTGS